MRQLVFVAALMLPTALAAAEEWGNLELRLVHDGEVPAPADDLVVNPKSKGIANIFVYLRPLGGEKPRMHPAYEDDIKRTVMWTIKDDRFVPRVISLRSGQPLAIENSDDHAYCLKIDLTRGINKVLPGKTTLDLKADAAESLPTRAVCVIQSNLNGWLLVRDDPYVAVSDADGKVAIRNLPTGKVRLAIWHERVGNLTHATLAGKKVTWPRGRMELDIKAGDNNLGEALVSPDEFVK